MVTAEMNESCRFNYNFSWRSDKVFILLSFSKRGGWYHLVWKDGSREREEAGKTESMCRTKKRTHRTVLSGFLPVESGVQRHFCRDRIGHSSRSFPRHITRGDERCDAHSLSEDWYQCDGGTSLSPDLCEVIWWCLYVEFRESRFTNG